MLLGTVGSANLGRFRIYFSCCYPWLGDPCTDSSGIMGEQRNKSGTFGEDGRKWGKASVASKGAEMGQQHRVQHGVLITRNPGGF